MSAVVAVPPAGQSGACARLSASERVQIEAVMPRVRHIVESRFRVGTLDPDDLFQVAIEALCRSVRRFDPSRASWRTYAQIRAEGAIRDYLRHEQPGTRANPAPHPLSLDEPWDNGDGTTVTIADLFPVDDPEPRDDRYHHTLQALIDRLPPGQARTIRFRAGGYTLKEIADLEGVTESAISIRYTTACKTLAAALPHTRPQRRNGVLLIDRAAHPTRDHARQAALDVHPGATIHAIEPRKVRGGRVTSCQGRPAADGSLGRPVWAVELAA